MKNGNLDAILVMGSIHRVLKAEKALLAAGLNVDTVVTPRAVSADCGMVVALSSADLDSAARVLSDAETEPSETWVVEGGKYCRVHDCVSGET